MNRQVPEKIAILGNGKVARHMIRYFELVNQPYTHWFRPSEASGPIHGVAKLKKFITELKLRISHRPPDLNQALEGVSKVLILIADDQIEAFIADHPILNSKTCIHFSGSLHTGFAIGCHPLMTFGHELYDLNTYQKIPFVVDEGTHFKELFPQFKNPFYVINAAHKTSYHALCVMAGNFSQMLWKAVIKELPALGLPDDIMSAYLSQNTSNFIADSEKSATGPLERGDYLTVQKHLKSLENKPLVDVYQAFLALHTDAISTEQRRVS